MRHFKDRASVIHGTPSIADQRALLTEGVAEAEEVAPKGGGLIHEEAIEIVKSNTIVEDNDVNWALGSIMTAEKVEASGLRDRMRAL